MRFLPEMRFLKEKEPCSCSWNVLVGSTKEAAIVGAEKDALRPLVSAAPGHGIRAESSHPIQVKGY